MRWPSNSNLDRTTCGAAKSREPHHDLTEKRGDRTLPVILHVTNASAARTIRPKNGVGPGLSGHDFLLENCKHLLRFGQSQTRARDVAKVIGAIDLNDVRGLPLSLAFGAGFHQPQNPAHTATPASDYRREE